METNALKSTRLRDRLFQQEDLNFLLTNRVPRIALTHFIGWFSKIEIPWITRGSIAVWEAFSDLDLSEAHKNTFTSLHDCFIRELKPGMQTVDTDRRCPRVSAMRSSAPVARYKA